MILSIFIKAPIYQNSNIFLWRLQGERKGLVMLGIFFKKKELEALKIGRFQLENLVNQFLHFEFFLVGKAPKIEIKTERLQPISMRDLKAKYLDPDWVKSGDKNKPIILAGSKKHKAARLLESLGLTQVFIYEDIE